MLKNTLLGRQQMLNKKKKNTELEDFIDLDEIDDEMETIKYLKKM